MSGAEPLQSPAKLAADIARARRRYEGMAIDGPRPITAYEPCEGGCGKHVVGVLHRGERFVAEAVAAIRDDLVPPECDYRLRVRRHRCAPRTAPQPDARASAPADPMSEGVA